MWHVVDDVSRGARCLGRRGRGQQRLRHLLQRFGSDPGPYQGLAGLRRHQCRGADVGLPGGARRHLADLHRLRHGRDEQEHRLRQPGPVHRGDRWLCRELQRRDIGQQRRPRRHRIHRATGLRHDNRARDADRRRARAGAVRRRGDRRLARVADHPRRHARDQRGRDRPEFGQHRGNLRRTARSPTPPSGLPDGLSIDPATGIISGTPTTVGTFTVTVAATDTAGSVGDAVFDWSVTDGSTTTTTTTTTTTPPPTTTTTTTTTPPPPPPHVSIAAPSAQSGQVGARAQLALQATDSRGFALTYGVTGLPVGLSVNPATGVISGTPLSAGTTTVHASVWDGHSGSMTAIFSWKIAPLPHVTHARLEAGVSSHREAVSIADDRLELDRDQAGPDLGRRWPAAILDEPREGRDGHGPQRSRDTGCHTGRGRADERDLLLHRRQPRQRIVDAPAEAQGGRHTSPPRPSQGLDRRRGRGTGIRIAAADAVKTLLGS